MPAEKIGFGGPGVLKVHDGYKAMIFNESLLGYWGEQKILRKETFILESSVANHSLAAFSLKFLISIPWHSASAILSPRPSLLLPLMRLPLSGFAFYDSLGLGARYCRTPQPLRQESGEMLQHLVERTGTEQGFQGAANAVS